MKKQVVFIHGGDIARSHREYIQFLENYKIDKKYLKRVKWHFGLDKELGNNYEVIKPAMPNGFNARYKEWEIWFRKYIPLLRKNVILIGGSLGGTFLVKYLSENKFPVKIMGLFLVAAPFGDREKYYLADFHFDPKNLKKLEGQCKLINIYHSKDDSDVSFSDFKKYKKYLLNSNFFEFKNRGHFVGEKFPEIIKDIKALK